MKKILAGPTGIIDVPWAYERTSDHEKLRGYSTDHEYPSLTTEELAKLPIGEMMNYLFMWTTGPFMEDAYKLIRAWGFKPITSLYWVKCTEIHPGGIAFPPELTHEGVEENKFKFKPEYNVGYWFRGCVEPIILAKRPGVPSIRTPFIGLLSPNAGHSRKPQTLHQLCESHFPGPYIEIFGRRATPGWTVLGNEAPGDGADIRVSIQKFLAETVHNS